MSKKFFTKDHYLLRNFSKISHKKWELYVVTRILHLLNDENLEYVCQQYVNPPENESYYLADLCFPSLQLYIEVNESQHGSKQHSINDKIREREIFDATNWEQKSVEVFLSMPGGKKIDKPLSEINREIDELILYIKNKKKRIEANTGQKIVWNYEEKFSPEAHIKKGYVDAAENTVFLYQRDALRLFGFKGKEWYRGYWPMKGSDSAVWFPRLYKSGVWHNSLSKDATEIVQKKIEDGELQDHALPEHNIRLIFGRYKNVLGQTVYKFYGEYQVDWQKTGSKIQVFKRTKSKVSLSDYHKCDDGYHAD